MIETLLAIVGTAYQAVSGVQSGRQFNKVLLHLQSINSSLQKLSDSIVYAPSVHVVKDQTQVRQNIVTNTNEIRDYLDPTSICLGHILSSQMIITPDKMRNAMSKNPWEVLEQIRPYERSTWPRDPDMVPISFEDRGKYYVGWQKRGVMPMMFDCEYRPDSSLWMPSYTSIGPETWPSGFSGSWYASLVSKSWTTRTLRMCLNTQRDYIVTVELHVLRLWNCCTISVDGRAVAKGGHQFQLSNQFFLSFRLVCDNKSVPCDVAVESDDFYRIKKFRLAVAGWVVYEER